MLKAVMQDEAEHEREQGTNATSSWPACVSQETLRVLREEPFRFSGATPVQSAALPLLLDKHKDVCVRAVTGSGKTLAFLIPMVEMIRRQSSYSGATTNARRSKKQKKKNTQLLGLVLAPTRELAQQTAKIATVLFKAHSISFATVIGGKGVRAEDEAKTLMNCFSQQDDNPNEDNLDEVGSVMVPQVIIGTPGRVKDVLPRINALDVRCLELLILDEADRLLALGFEEEVKAIIAMLPKQRRTGLFSATQTDAVDQLIKVGMRNPVRITVLSASETDANLRDKQNVTGLNVAATIPIPAGLKCYFTLCESDALFSQLVTFLVRNGIGKKCIIYFLTCACVDFAASVLPELPGLKKFIFIHLHGKMKQSAREKALARFSTAEHAVLVATDVAARGLDIPGVDWVIQADPPQDPASFVHRIGRTARMGRTGNSIIYLHPHEDTYINYLQNKDMPMEEREPESDCQPVLSRYDPF